MGKKILRVFLLNVLDACEIVLTAAIQILVPDTS